MATIEFHLEDGFEYVELNQLLKLCGLVGSGGEGKHVVASGAVTVDGQVELRRTCKIRAGQWVQVGGQDIRVLAPVAGG